MNRTTVSILALSVAALSAGQALAAEPAGKTRAQVQAELAEAIRTGDIGPAGPDHRGRKLNEIVPGNYPAKAQVATKSRSEVKAELAEAVRTGNIVSDNEAFAGKKLNQVFPGQYPRQS